MQNISFLNIYKNINKINIENCNYCYNLYEYVLKSFSSILTKIIIMSCLLNF